MDETLFIARKRSLNNGEDFEFLREKGLEYIRNLAGKIWTDHNLHDPGITTLEALCYSITDLGYRSGYEVEDLIAFSPDDKDAKNKSFHTARNIFPCNPTTLNDFRKVLIDIEGVRNAWVETVTGCEETIYLDCEAEKLTLNAPLANLLLSTPYSINEIPLISSPLFESVGPLPSNSQALSLKGMYRVRVLLEEEIKAAGPTAEQEVLEKVFATLNRYRNLAEDWCDIKVVNYEPIGICMDIDVKPEADINEILAQIYFQVGRFLNPAINFYSIEELLDKGKKVDEVFEGPILEHGFIDEDELDDTQEFEFIFTSDLYNIIMDIEGIIAVKKMLITNFDQLGNALNSGQEWCLELSTPTDCRVPQLDPNESSITFYKGDLPFFASEQKVALYLRDLKATERNRRLGLFTPDLEIPRGDYKSIDDYAPFTNDFPITYGIGPDGLPDSASDARKAQASQFKAYLLFFEQIIANYFSQLGHVRDLFTWSEADEDANVVPTYYTQALTGINGIEDLYTDYSNIEDNLLELIEGDEERLERRNRFLDHLLARFSEEMTDYSLILFSQFNEGLVAQEELLRDKARFLQDYPALSRDRFKGFDLTLPEDSNGDPDYWDTLTNITGYQRRIARAIGINDPSRRNLSQYNFSIVRVKAEVDGEILDLFKYVFEFDIRTSAGYVSVTLSSPGTSDEPEGLFSSEYQAEQFMERHLPFFCEPDSYVPAMEPGIIPDPDLFYIEVEDEDENVLALTNFFANETERNSVIERIAWYFQSFKNCYPPEIYGLPTSGLFANEPGDPVTDHNFEINHYVDGPNVELELSSPVDFVSEEAATAAMFNVLDNIRTLDVVINPDNNVDQVWLINEVGDVLAQSQDLGNPLVAQSVRIYCLVYFKEKENCDPRGLHLIEHLLIRPRDNRYDEDTLLGTCIHCVEETVGAGQDAEIEVIKENLSSLTSGQLSQLTNSSALKITTLDLDGEKVTITNESPDPVNLGGWTLRSYLAGQAFPLPDTKILAPGDSIEVLSGPTGPASANGNTSFGWTRRHVWNNLGDAAQLFSPLNILSHQTYAAGQAGGIDEPGAGAELTVPEGSIVINSLDINNESVVIENLSNITQDMTGWIIISGTAFQTYQFPDGFELTGGSTVTVISGSGASSAANGTTILAWTNQYVWNNLGDTATLAMPNGRVIDSEIGLGGVVETGLFRFHVRDKSSGDYLMSSQIYDTRNKRDQALIRAYEYGALFTSFELADGEIVSYKLFGDLDISELLMFSVFDYDGDRDLALADIERIYAFFADVIESEASSEEEEETEVDPCAYENDPYSFRLSILMPGWVEDFGSPDYRRFAEQKIRYETPAHLYPRICWISRWQMRQLELAYQAWILANAHYRELMFAEADFNCSGAYASRRLSDPPVSEITLIYDLTTSGNPLASSLEFYADAGLTQLLLSEDSPSNGDVYVLNASDLENAHFGNNIYVVVDGGAARSIDTGPMSDVQDNINSGNPVALDFVVLDATPFYTYQLEKLISIIHELRNVYPVRSRLHDCEGEDTGDKIILDNSNLG